MPKIVILDSYTSNPGDLSWADLEALGDCTFYDRTPAEKTVERSANADILVLNKAKISAEVLQELPELKAIFILATGFDNVDGKAAAARGIPVCNVVGYSTDAVVQQVFSLLLELTNGVGLHNESVQNGEWQRNPDFSFSKFPISELSGKTMGIFGFGQIGKRVSDMALAFGMKVLATKRNPSKNPIPGVTFVDQDTLFSQSDVLSLHAPLSPETNQIINRSILQKIKSSAILINTGRGGLIHENDLKWALENGEIAGAGLDVLSKEPPEKGHPLIGLKNCIITPHQAWASSEARARLIAGVVENVKAFLAGNPINVVN